MQIISQKTVETLPKEYMEIIQECAKESALYKRELWQQREQQSEQVTTRAGTIITELSEEERMKFQNACQPIYQKYAGKYTYLLTHILDTPDP